MPPRIKLTDGCVIRVNMGSKGINSTKRLEQFMATHQASQCARLMDLAAQSVAMSAKNRAIRNIYQREGEVNNAPHGLKITGEYVGSFTVWKAKDSTRTAPKWEVGVPAGIMHTRSTGDGANSQVAMAFLAMLFEYGGEETGSDAESIINIPAYPHWGPAVRAASNEAPGIFNRMMQRWLQEGRISRVEADVLKGFK